MFNLRRLTHLCAVLSPVLLTSVAFGIGSDVKYSPTAQSGVVDQAIARLRAGDQDAFVALLGGDALAQFGTRDAAQRLLARMDERVATAPGAREQQMINDRTYTTGHMEHDSMLALVSNRSYPVERLAGPVEANHVVSSFVVTCSGASFFDSSGGTQLGCRITGITIGGAARAGADGGGFARLGERSQAPADASSLAAANIKRLSGADLLAGAAAGGTVSAGAASVMAPNPARTGETSGR